MHTTPEQDQDTMAATEAPYLGQLLDKLEAAIVTFENSEDADAANAARDLDHASRSAASEYQALRIDRATITRNDADRLRDLHAEAIHALESRKRIHIAIHDHSTTVRKRFGELLVS